MANIKELLGSDGFKSTRLTINANFLTLQSELNDLASGLNINSSTGVLDVSTRSVGEIKAKKLVSSSLYLLNNVGANAITLNANGAGGIVASSIKVSGDVEGSTVKATLVQTTDLTAAGNLTVSGVTKVSAVAQSITDAGIQTPTTLTYTVRNDLNVLNIGFVTANSVLTLQEDADAPLTQGHTVTIVNVGTVAMKLDVASINGGFTSITLAQNRRSAITLMLERSTAKWTIVSSNNVSLV